MATAIYVRVSSKSQKEASQVPDLERWVKSQDDDEVLWYRDRFTGTTMERAGWEKLWATVLLGRISRIVVWRIDRLGRTASGLTKLFEDQSPRRDHARQSPRRAGPGDTRGAADGKRACISRCLRD